MRPVCSRRKCEDSLSARETAVQSAAAERLLQNGFSFLPERLNLHRTGTPD